MPFLCVKGAKSKFKNYPLAIFQSRKEARGRISLSVSPIPVIAYETSAQRKILRAAGDPGSFRIENYYTYSYVEWIL